MAAMAHRTRSGEVALVFRSAMMTRGRPPRSRRTRAGSNRPESSICRVTRSACPSPTSRARSPPSVRCSGASAISGCITSSPSSPANKASLGSQSRISGCRPARSPVATSAREHRGHSAGPRTLRDSPRSAAWPCLHETRMAHPSRSVRIPSPPGASGRGRGTSRGCRCHRWSGARAGGA